MDLFLYHYMMFRTSTEFKVEHLYQVFRNWWDSVSGRDVTDELQELRKFSAVYRQLLEPVGNDRFAQFSRRLRALDTTTAYPLVLWAASLHAPGTETFDAILDDLESFFLRRAVCGYGSKSYTRSTVEWLSKLRSVDVADAQGTLRGLLLASSAESQVWPTDAEFRDAIVTEPLYNARLRPRAVIMLLEALDRAFLGRLAENVEVTSTLSVEHVLPQHPAEGAWPLERVHEDENESLRTRNRLTHVLGNLTLVTQPLNSSVSNGPYSRKREALDEHSLLPINLYFRNQATWTLADIRTRGSVLAEAALNLWQRP
jgi:hypothetical protein